MMRWRVWPYALASGIAVICLALTGLLVSSFGVANARAGEASVPELSSADTTEEWERPFSHCWTWYVEKSLERQLAGDEERIERQVCFDYASLETAHELEPPADGAWRWTREPASVPSYAGPEGGCFGPRKTHFSYSL